MNAHKPEQYGKVAVLMGGHSGERAISLKSGAAILAALQKLHIDAHPVDVDKECFTQLAAAQYDRAFIALHGVGGEDGTMQGALQTIGIPYTGSGVMASSICMNKIITKQLWLAAGINTPAYVALNEQSGYPQLADQLGSTFIIKPSQEGSSLGIHKVNNAAEYAAAVAEAKQHQGQLMAEQWIAGKEYTVAILEQQALPVIRLETPNQFYDYEAKYQADTTQYLIPCGLSAELEGQLQVQAQQAFAATGAQGWGRVDVMMDGNNRSWLLEVNTVPGMTDHSLVPMAAAAQGIDFTTLVEKILDTSFAVKN